MLDPHDLIATMLDIVDSQSKYPGEAIDREIMAELGHLWLAKHQRTWNKITTDPQMTVAGQIKNLLSSPLDDVIDSLTTIALSLMDSIEYTYSTNALNAHMREEGWQRSLSVIGADGKVVETDDLDGITNIAEIVAKRRVPDLPMQMDHLDKVIGAIRVCLILKESLGMPVLKTEDGPIMESLAKDAMGKGRELSPDELAARLPRFFNPDGTYKFPERSMDDTEEGGEETSNQ